MAGSTTGLTPVVVGLGSNLESPAEQVTEGIRRLSVLLHGARPSGLYASAPMYVESQPEFVNAVCTGLTDLGPFALHRQLKRIEEEAGRITTAPNGPRVLDLDLIAYGCLELRSPGLHLPHPRAWERRFVLEPWLEVAEAGDISRLRTALTGDPIGAQSVIRVRDAIL